MTYYNLFINRLDMNTTPEHDRKIAKMIFASVYPHYVAKVESKGRTIASNRMADWL